MSFGRKGLAQGQGAPAHAGSGFGRAVGATAPEPAPRAPVGISDQDADVSSDEIAARREAFLAAERERSAAQVGPGEVSDVAVQAGSDLSALRNSARPARPMGEAVPAEPLGENGLPKSQEEKIKAMAREMSRGGRSSGSMASGGSAGASKSNPWAGKKFVFGDPLKRNLVLAYVIWYFAGGFGIHRAYCGYMESGIYQFAMFVAGVVILFIFPPLGLILLLGWAIWLFADLFLMPGMMKRFKAAHDYDAGVFE